MKKYTVYLFKSPDCVRGWLAYVRPDHLTPRATLHVEIEAKNGVDAKNKAITAANNGFKGLKIVRRNFGDELWGIDLFPGLAEETFKSILSISGK